MAEKIPHRDKTAAGRRRPSRPMRLFWASRQTLDASFANAARWKALFLRVVKKVGKKGTALRFMFAFGYSS